jgi:hypothetical protein
MQDFQSNSLASEGEGHKFCYVYWEHGPNSKTSLYYLDTPDPLGAAPHRIFQATEELRDFVNHLKRVGWQEYMSNANQEAYEKWLMRLPPLDSRYEYCVFSCAITTDGSQPPRRKALYRLGERNDYLLTGEMWQLDYNGVLQYLEREQWEFTHQEEYPAFRQLPNHRVQLRFYRRPLA